MWARGLWPTVRYVDAVDVVVRVTANDTGEQRCYVLRCVTLPYVGAGDADDWSTETVTTLNAVHADDIYKIFDDYRE